MKNYKNEKSLFVALLGCTICLMFTLMYLGGFKSLTYFLGSEAIYDFPETDMIKNAKGWEYHEEENGYYIVKNNAVNKYRVDRYVRTWKYLYLTISNCSVSEVHAILEYYDKEKNILKEQPIVIYNGENEIELDETIEIYRIGIRIRDAKGIFFSMNSMEIRSEKAGFSWQKFYECMGMSLLICGCVIFMGYSVRKKYVNTENYALEKNTGLLYILQSLYVLQGNIVGKKAIQKCRKIDRKVTVEILLCVFFAWILFFEIMGWTKGESYRYFSLGCAVILFACGCLLWKKEWKNTGVMSSVLKSWYGLWIMMALSDVFKEDGEKFFSYVMTFSAGFFIFAYNQRFKADAVICLFLRALEIDYVLVVLFCVFFRPKIITVYYNGICRRPEDFAMYALLIFALFVWKIYGLIDNDASYLQWIGYGMGAASALYFVLRSGGVVAKIALILVAITYLYGCVYIWVKKRGGFRYRWKQILTAIVFSFLCVVVIHISVKYLPDILQTTVVFEDEQLVSVLPEDELQLYQQMFPITLENVTSKDTINVMGSWKNYARMMGLYGNATQIYRNSEPVQAYNGYLDLMYHYGIFAVIPFVLYQIYGFCISLKKCRRFFGKKNPYIFVLCVNIIFTVFCVFGNASVNFGNIAVWCYFLFNGVYFKE